MTPVAQSPDSKIAHLQMIQGVIARMASDAQSTKTLAMTVAAAIIALAQAGGGVTHLVAACGAVLMALFWFLTARSLHVERAYRELYDRVRKDEPVEAFTMEWRPYDSIVPAWYRLGITWSVLLPYAAAVVILVVVSFITWGNATNSGTTNGGPNVSSAQQSLP